MQSFSTQSPQFDQIADAKLARAIEFYANRHRFDQRGGQHLHLQMLLWSMWLRFVLHLKRLFDLSMTLLALFTLWPLLALTAIAIQLDSPGPVIFKQTRIGKWGRPFTCYKFRSMCIDAEARKAELRAANEADGPVFKIHEDPRVTRVGRIIRRLSIDELPQLFNILRGEMSLVGPRPPLPDEVRQYQLIQMQRLNVVPGLTGLQQISGRSDLNFERWIELDLQYIAEQSLWNDLRIICKTIPAVFFGRGAY